MSGKVSRAAKIWNMTNSQSSPEYPMVDLGSGPSPISLTACTLMSKAEKLPTSVTIKGGDLMDLMCQDGPLPKTFLHITLYSKPGPLKLCLSISCKNTDSDLSHTVFFCEQLKCENIDNSAFYSRGPCLAVVFKLNSLKRTVSKMNQTFHH